MRDVNIKSEVRIIDCKPLFKYIKEVDGKELNIKFIKFNNEFQIRKSIIIKQNILEKNPLILYK